MAIVHMHPDLDACACVALAGESDVHFLPAGEKVLPAQCPCCGKKFTGSERILDHPLGDKGRLEENGVRHAAACSMPEANSADPNLLAEVDEQDSTGKVVAPRFSLAAIVAAVRREASERGARGIVLDREVVAVMAKVINGINLAHRDKEAGREIARNCQIVLVGNFRVAILPQTDVSPILGIVLNEEMDVSCAIFAQDFNLGVTRYPGRETPDLRLLAPYLEGWFIHSAGFLAAWGTRKSPATCPPPKGTPQTQEELLAILRKVFEKK